MKTASPALVTLLNSSSNFLMADLWSFTLTNGVILRYTTADINITESGNTWSANDVLVTGGNLKISRGLTVDETDLTCYPSPSSMVGSIAFLQAVREGLFDRAVVRRRRVFMPTWGDTSAGDITLFLGEASDIQATRNMATIKCKSALNLLNTFMPRRQYQPTCSWVFGDSNCGVNRTALAVTSAVGAGSAGSTLLCTFTRADHYFDGGVVRMTSGLNAGVSRTIKTWLGSTASLVAPFPNAMTAGDAFTITPGCNKSYAGAVTTMNGSVGASSPGIIYCSIDEPDGFFVPGSITMMSGQYEGQTIGVVGWSKGKITLANPFYNNGFPAVGDSFSIATVPTNSQGSCAGYGNTARFGGMPFVPLPETSI